MAAASAKAESNVVLGAPPSATDYAKWRTAAQKTIQVGQPIPKMEFSYLRDGNPIATSTGEFSKGKWVIRAFPGPHTPICKLQLPVIAKEAEALEKNGIKTAILTSGSRDVVAQWIDPHDPHHTLLPIPDWGGDITFGLGIGMDKSEPRNLGFVPQRAMVGLNNGICSFVSIEPDSSKCTLATSTGKIIELFSRLDIKNVGV